MAFWGHSFIFDGVPSETYNLYISSPSGGDVSTNASTNVTMFFDQPLRRNVPFFLGAKLSDRLTFPISINSPEELTAREGMLIEKWLFGHKVFKILRIDQFDMLNIYYNVIFESPQIKRNGNLITGFDCVVSCDAPWAWETIKPIHYTFPPSSANFVINNTSDDKDYIKPKITVVMNTAGGVVNIVNLSENNRICTLTGMSANETLVIDSNLGVLTSSLGLIRLGASNFNGIWTRLIGGENSMQVTGNVSSITFNYKLPRKIGG